MAKADYTVNVSISLSNPDGIKNLAEALQGLVKALRPFADKPTPAGFEVGDRVKAIGGTWRGQTGIVVHVDGADLEQTYKVRFAGAAHYGNWPMNTDLIAA
jgi:hypothetical protein